MFQCPKCGTRYYPQIDSECPNCKEKELEEIIAEQWKAIEQNLIIIEQYLNDIKQHRLERERLWKDIEDRLQKIEQLKSLITEIKPTSITAILSNANNRAANHSRSNARRELDHQL